MTRARSRTNSPRVVRSDLSGSSTRRARVSASYSPVKSHPPSNHTRTVLVVVVEELVIDIGLGLASDVSELDALTRDRRTSVFRRRIRLDPEVPGHRTSAQAVPRIRDQHGGVPAVRGERGLHRTHAAQGVATGLQ